MSRQESNLLDSHFSRFLAERSGLSGNEKEWFRQLVKTLTSAQADGNACLPVSEGDAHLLKDLALVSAGGQTPLVLYNRRLYLHRYYHYEKRLAMQISTMAAMNVSLPDSEGVLEGYLADTAAVADWQNEAAKVALHKTPAIICGGPGTGKTTTVVKILALLLQVAGRKLDIALAAPTGKAAMRLSESIRNSLAWMELPKKIVDLLPTQATTLHRLLGYRHHSPQFRHTCENPLGWDVVVVDEASMVDLALMSKLVDALKPGTRLLLLGDKDQLASVESGAVLGDLIKSLPDNTVELQKTYRFNDNIKRLATSINTGDSATAWALLADATADNITVLQTDIIEHIGHHYAQFMAEVYRSPRPEVGALFQSFNRFQVLCAIHYGNQGVAGINRRVELSLTRRGFACPSDSWYPGRPVLITRNDYSLDLFNGDIGLCLPDPVDGSILVWFAGTNGGMRSYSPYRLPPCETVFAMTIHKSQGSEFANVVVVLPDEDNRILSRELIYTAVTRAKESVAVVAGQQVFKQALSRNIERCSGLAELLNEQLL